ncbi:hypothetical protein BD769DRAFT_763307 [Suillus cothurnatus]|nr:hypothetical protein BD769DRAFT_763307 [Suillus cothurnatus]
MTIREPSLCREPMLSHFGRATISNIAEELRCRILSFLPYNDILRCASTCRIMHMTVKNSVELQYILELGSQGLVQVHPQPPNVSIEECLRILREKANAWSSFNLNVTKKIKLPSVWPPHSSSLTHRQLGLAWYFPGNSSESYKTVMSEVIDTETCAPDPENRSLCRWNKDDPIPGITTADEEYIDETHDLFVTVDILDTRPRRNSKFQINFRQLSTGEKHHLSHGSQLVTVTRPRSKRLSSRVNVDHDVLVDVLGDRVALYGAAIVNDDYKFWSLHVWNWHEGQQAHNICAVGEGQGFIKMRFLVKEKLLALTECSGIELYDIEDLSKAPQLQARFMLPIHLIDFEFQYPSVFHDALGCAHLMAPDERWIWATNPADRIICVTEYSNWMFVITARLFFMDIPPSWFNVISEEDEFTVPWLSWGPRHSRCFRLPPASIFEVGGSRVIWVVHKDYGSEVRMMDFNPSAVARGIGKVVQEHTTFSWHNKNLEQYLPITTYLPYAEVVIDRTPDIFDVNLDEEKVAMFLDDEIVEIIGL